MKDKKFKKSGPSRPRQTSFIPRPKREHGGSLSTGKRRAYRPLNTKLNLHITLKSQHSIGPRSLFRHKKMILFVMKLACLRFNVKVSEYALAGNHIHLLIKGKSRKEIQNFFRVFAGHVAQNILKKCPPQNSAGGAPATRFEDEQVEVNCIQSSRNEARDLPRKGCKKNQRKFWSYLIYSRMVTWGHEFRAVTDYIRKNLLETLHVIAYEPRASRNSKSNSS